MNIAQLLIPKNNVATVFDDSTLRQGLEKLKYHGYTAIPVVTRDNHYVGTVSEGDFLWYLVDQNNAEDPMKPIRIQSTETLYIRDILSIDRNPPLRINASIAEVISRAMRQNFIPVIDDREYFSGIVTRQDIIRYFYSRADLSSQLQTSERIASK